MFFDVKLQFLQLCMISLIGYFSYCFSYSANAQSSVAPKIELKVAVFGIKQADDQRYKSLFNAFNEKYPNIRLSPIGRDYDNYKVALEHWFESGVGPDLIMWQGGDQFFHLVRNDQVLSLTDFWQQNGLHEKFSPNMIAQVTMDDQVYGLPFTYYSWGLLYRTSFLKTYELQPPMTWSQLLEICDTLNKHNIAAIGIGAKNHWPLAGWFDYINLRLHGDQFHRELLAGKHSFLDERVNRVFQYLLQLIQHRCIFESPESLDWLDPLPLIYRDRIGFTFMGSFIVSHIVPHLKEDFQIIGFPIIDIELPVTEVAPTDVFFIPTYSKKAKWVEKILLFLSQATIQAEIAAQSYVLPANKYADLIARDQISKNSREIVDKAINIAPFFDRGSAPGFSKKAMPALTRFLSHQNIEMVLQELEALRRTEILK